MTLDTPSEYLLLPLRDEQTVRSQIAEKGQNAFFDIAKIRSSTTYLLNRAKNKAHCLTQNENLDEDEYNAKMIAFCLSLTDGDEPKAKLLASAAST